MGRYGQMKMDHYENNTTAIPTIDAVQAEVENEDFMEELDGALLTLNDNLKPNVKQLAAAKKLKSEEVEYHMRSHKPMSIDVYKFLAADGALTNCSNIPILFKISLLILPSTLNVSVVFWS